MVSTSSGVLGSSPLTRGAREVFDRATQDFGLIPAHAGSTHARETLSPRTRAHPRSRGEHRTTGTNSSARMGSSPLTRGARQSSLSPLLHVGLIPAHAGSTYRCPATSRTRPAHPRSRGEHRFLTALRESKSGSSPLTRGAPNPNSLQPLPLGLIPAHAGSTVWRRGRECWRRAHPRSRGEHHFRRSFCRISLGSSPLTRGALHVEKVVIARLGLIPAHAGST